LKSHPQCDKRFNRLAFQGIRFTNDSRFGDGWSPDTTIDLEMRRARMGEGDQAGGEQPYAGETAPEENAAPTPDGAAPPQEPASNQALSGVQVTSLLETIKSVIRGEIPRDSAQQVIMLSYNVSADEADRLLGSAGKGFRPTPEPASTTPEPTNPPVPPEV